MSEQNGQDPTAGVFDPSKLEEHGVTLPVPTPTGMVVPNPWNPPNGASPPSLSGPLPQPISGGTDSDAESD